MAVVSKKYPLASLKRRSVLLPVIAALLVGAGLMQRVIDPAAKKYHQGENNLSVASSGLNNEFLLLPLLGFREAAAGLLWVRCDEFFHSGDYDAILPLVRLITLLDPHADNVYVTGAWHLAYNFTDSSERSDRRYIDPSQKLLDEGIINNMYIPDIKFEKGWECYDKIKDFPAAEKAFKLAIDTKPNPNSDDYPYGAPIKTWHILAHTYEKQGRIPEALAMWKEALGVSSQFLKVAKSNESKYSATALHSIEQKNYNEMLVRWHDRYTTTQHSHVNTSTYPAVLRPAPGGKPGPWEASFATHINVVRAKVLKIGGTINIADGARVDVKLTDWDYKERPIANTINTFEVDQTQTIMMDSLSIRKDKFDREIDMSKDPKMYSFGSPFYRIVLTFNSRTTSPHIQDRHGWNGEGITDVNPAHIYVDGRDLLRGTKLIDGQGGEGPVWDGVTIPWGQHGQAPRFLRVTYKVSKEQIDGNKKITDADIVPNQQDL